MLYDTHILSNGIKLIHQRSNSPVAHCGIIIHTGSRDEKPHEHGMAHFIEHLLFKGTNKRKAYQIINLIENAGGELNAYTTKEETCVYISFLNEDYNRSLELLSDIVFNSSYPNKEIEREIEVILDEINSYKDSPAELIFDEFEEIIFHPAPIARNILGTKKNIKTFTRKKINKFIADNYHTDQIVISSVGNIPFSKYCHIAEKYFGHILANYTKKSRDNEISYHPSTVKIRKKTYQTHCILGNIAYAVKDERRLGMIILNNILGGPNLNSRLNIMLREKHGYAYNIESMYHPYTDTGILAIYFGTDKDNFNKAINLIHKEFDKLRNIILTTRQLHAAQRQLLGQIAIASESNENVMLSNGKSFLIFEKVDSFEEIKNKIMNVTSEDLITIANDILVNSKMSMLVYE